MVTVKVHFDGKVFVPDEPVNFPLDAALLAQVRFLDEKPKSFRSLIGRAFDYPPNPNPKMLTEDEIWENPEKPNKR